MTKLNKQKVKQILKQNAKVNPRVPVVVVNEYRQESNRQSDLS